MNTVEPIRKVVENITSAGRDLGKVLSERVSDIGDRNTCIAELLHEPIGVGDVRNLIRYGFIYEDGHGWRAVKAHGGTCFDGIHSDRVYEVGKVSVAVQSQFIIGG
jgi:hypothetical protein